MDFRARQCLPTNLPPDYFNLQVFSEALNRRRKDCAASANARGAKHKGTDHLRVDFRRKLAKLNEVFIAFS